MGHGDFPIGILPLLLRAGARYCIGARFRIGAEFAAKFIRELGVKLAQGLEVSKAFSETSDALEKNGADLWRDLACIELIGGP